jgi:circadian clock protein KaiC
VVLDPVSSFETAGTWTDALSMLSRLIDRFKSQQISTMLTSLTGAGNAAEHSAVGLSSLIDGWILLRSLEQDEERTRALYVLKARGIKHSHQVRELLISDRGLDLEQIQAPAPHAPALAVPTILVARHEARTAALHRKDARRTK